ncbi:ketopantoate reductase family protein [Kineosporia succinea]|uniref:2-dehydropantoate 2-reductase n=1 Tax=Kineosporia succinea TaxID=84632 RepID=A0ABT9PA20_9ACTN|nr:2-dehydropantoate 2-reductase N-terminal domain-containing protein [Kineosporia succinea]MDP9829541.1 2-dehydropantoate 2-reductase [Kineosporia succinea]
MNPRYVIIGAGAIGGTVGHAMVAAGENVVLVDTDAAHVEAIRSGGLRIRAVDGTDDTVRIPAYTPEDYPADAPPADFAVVATKSQHTRTATEWAASRLAPDGRVVSLQNGINEPVIAEIVGAGRVISAFVNIFSDYLEPGVVSFGGTGALSVGMPTLSAPDAYALEVARAFRAYGPVTASANVGGYRFAKRGFGGILGLTSVVDAPMAQVVDAHRDLAAAVARESTEVAVRAGVVLESFDGYEPYAFRADATDAVREAALDRLVTYLTGQPKDRSGGFRDIAVRRRPTEKSLIDDGYAALAAEHGVDTRMSTAVGRMLGELSAGTREFTPANLDELRAILNA